MDDTLKRLVEKLSRAEVFSHLTEEERLELAGMALRKSLKKGDVICFQGDDCRFVLYIASGTLRSVIGAPDGREYVVSTWEAGEEFWSHTLLDGEPMPSTLEAITATVIYRWPGEQTLELLLSNHAATRALIRRQTQLIRKRRESIYNLAFNPVASRLAKLVVDKFINAEGPTVQRDLTLEEMASMVATSPEVICRVLYQFQAEGLLKVNRASITLHDRERLEKLIIKD
ncbi:MAG: Crp/Fnr family transcriptional regulator [Anaerolineales bacterium]|nr:Crp/Fnr family transcriptional regulator [Anaerolineales bacterium]